MATLTKFHTSKSISSSIAYGRDDAKKNKLDTAVSLNCNPKHVIDQMASVQKFYKKFSKDSVKIHQHILSFKPGEINKIGAKHYVKKYLEYVSKSLGKNNMGGWQMVAFSHKNRPSYHFHIYIGAVNAKTGKKYHKSNEVRELRKINDKVAKEFGLNIVKPTKIASKSMEDIKSEEKAKKEKKPKPYSYQDHARKVISVALLNSHDETQFNKEVKKQGGNVKRAIISKAKNATIQIPFIKKDGSKGKQKFRSIRTNRLGLGFTKQKLSQVINQPENSADKKVYKKFTGQSENNKKKSHSHTLDKSKNAEFYMKSVPKKKFMNKKEIENDKAITAIREIKGICKRDRSDPLHTNARNEKQESTTKKETRRKSRKKSESKSKDKELQTSNDIHESSKKDVREANNQIRRSDEKIRQSDEKVNNFKEEFARLGRDLYSKFRKVGKIAEKAVIPSFERMNKYFDYVIGKSKKFMHYNPNVFKSNNNEEKNTPELPAYSYEQVKNDSKKSDKIANPQSLYDKLFHGQNNDSEKESIRRNQESIRKQQEKEKEKEKRKSKSKNNSPYLPPINDPDRSNHTDEPEGPDDGPEI